MTLRQQELQKVQEKEPTSTIRERRANQDFLEELYLMCVDPLTE